jgi:hypothetical protein
MTLRTAFVLAIVTGFAGNTAAKSIRFVPVAERVGRADVVVIGTVAEVDADPVQVDLYGGGRKTWMRMARVKIAEDLLGAAGLTHVRVGFVGAEDQPDTGQTIHTPVLEKGNEVILFLRKRTGNDFYHMDGHFGAAGKAPKHRYLAFDFKEVADEARPLCRLLADPMKGLKSADEKDRARTAWMLVTRYRAYPADNGLGTLKEESIPAAESKLILENLPLLEKINGHDFRHAVSELRLQKEDGFEKPVYADGGTEAAVNWLKAQAGTYRIKKYVVEKKK